MRTYDKPLFEDLCGAGVLLVGVGQIAGERHVFVEGVERIQVGQGGQLAEHRLDDNEKYKHGNVEAHVFFVTCPLSPGRRDY